MENTYFISGHLDLTPTEFEQHYVNRIDNARQEGSHFVIGDARGADTLAQKYLLKYENVTIYHMFTKPRNNKGKWKTVGGFTNDNDRDVEMTKNSTKDILWIRSAEQQKKILGSKYDPNYLSGTAKNMLRRT